MVVEKVSFKNDAKGGRLNLGRLMMTERTANIVEADGDL